MTLSAALPLQPNSSNQSESTHGCRVDDQMVPFTFFYILIFLVGIVGSLLALWAFCHSRNAKMCINVYLMNLLTADFLLMLALPFKITVDLGVASWSLRIFHCQVSAVLIYINMYASIVFLAFVSADRYLQIAQNSRLFRIQEVGFARMMSLVVWALLLFLMVPNMAIPIKSLAEKPHLRCAELKQELGLHWHTLTNFLCMAIFLNACVVVLLSNSFMLKRLWAGRGGDQAAQAGTCRATSNIAGVTLAYVVCFVPYHLVRTPYTLTQNQVLSGCQLARRLFLAKESTLMLAIMHICFDPILYYCLSHSFRQKVTEAFGAGKAVPLNSPELISQPSPHQEENPQALACLSEADDA
ncbi:probable G-protein coupled receptor 171 [Scleropages formosus]|uniref:G protein-coupled receptor 171 n=1 Tax=Scleropages formosus TaxID=113540 RepID=A0A8C9S0L4_SCLFO|nr:probable G-protein coupled receptor 171 [Scleropages formosus]XP_018604062.1 probable G-protein coupled receptor 171 [Scleropages formosus]